MWTARRCLSVTAAAATITVTSACGGHPTSAAASVADEFAQALDASDAAAACGYLAPRTKSDLEQSAGKACPAALTEEKLPSAGTVEETDAFGTMAEVKFSKDTMFLAEFKGGWKVMAAGCKPQPGQPYDCRLQGG